MSTKSLKEKLKARNQQATAEAVKRQLQQNRLEAPVRETESRNLPGVNRFIFINVTSAPLENLVAAGRMETREDEPGQGLMRASVATRVRSTFEGAYLAGMRSPDMEPSGGSAGGGRPVSDYKLDCMAQIDRIRGNIPALDFQIVEGVCYLDKFLWRGLARREERAMVLRIHKALDRAGVALGMIDAESVKKRWARKPASAPKPKAKA